MSTLNVDKVDPNTGTALEIGTSGDTITVPSGATFVVAGTTEITGTNNVQRPNAQPLIINGNMAVAQRSTSVASITASGYQTIDRYRTGFSGTLGTWTQSQSTDVPTGKGFANSLKMDCTTADASPGVATRLSIRYNFEGQNLQLLKKGTSDAEKITLAFWVKSSKTGIHIVNMVDQDNTRNISKSYTVSSADTWEQVVLNFDGDTTGTLDDDNAQSLFVDFYLGAGTNYTSGTLATSWETVNNTDVAVGQVNLADSTSNDFLFTGVQLEVGEYTSSTLPPFQHESYQDNFLRCARYYTEYGGAADGSFTANYDLLCEANGTSAFRNATFWTPVPLRAVPSINNPTMVYFDYDTTTANTSGGTVTVLGGGERMSCVSIAGSGAANLVDAKITGCRVEAVLTMDAEL